MNMTALSATLLSDCYPLGPGSHAKSEFDMLEVSRNPLRLMTSLPESDTPKIYIVHFNARKCSDVCARSLSLAIHTISCSECHIMMLIVNLHSTAQIKEISD